MDRIGLLYNVGIVKAVCSLIDDYAKEPDDIIELDGSTTITTRDVGGKLFVFIMSGGKEYSGEKKYGYCMIITIPIRDAHPNKWRSLISRHQPAETVCCDVWYQWQNRDDVKFTYQRIGQKS